MTRLVFLIVTCILLINTQGFSAQESKLGTAFNAAIWGAGIGIVSGLGFAALATSDKEEIGTTSNRVRNNMIQGFGTGILARLIFGMFEISEIFTSYNVLYNFNSKQTLVAYNFKF